MTYSKKYFLNLFLFFALFYKTNAQEQHHNDKEKNGHHANEYMHQSNFDELVKRFESPERDAYQQPEKVLEFLGDIKGKKIMDIGAGSGYFSVKLAQKGAHVIAADVSDEFQQFIKERIKKDNISNIELRKIPFNGPSLGAKEVDMVFIVNTYHHIEVRSEYFKLVKKGIKDHGELIIIDFFKTEIPVGPPVAHKIAIDDIIAELKLAGFSKFTIDVNLLAYQFIIRAI
jgi:cyclopropane fatty-acyl-phospholipid synthase-like methyltransferase